MDEDDDWIAPSSVTSSRRRRVVSPHETPQSTETTPLRRSLRRSRSSVSYREEDANVENEGGDGERRASASTTITPTPSGRRRRKAAVSFSPSAATASTVVTPALAPATAPNHAETEDTQITPRRGRRPKAQPAAGATRPAAKQQRQQR
ncbi:hypothetical protein HK405_014955, partial [Cladochytrium tenue]